MKNFAEKNGATYGAKCFGYIQVGTYYYYTYFYQCTCCLINSLINGEKEMSCAIC